MAFSSSSSPPCMAGHELSEREHAAVEWLLSEKERNPTELSLVVWRYHQELIRYTDDPNRDHVRSLWQMKPLHRRQLWHRVGRFDRLHVLELGGCVGCRCPLDWDEVSLLLPEDQDALSGLRVLSLVNMTRLDDHFLRMLAERGCGGALERLTLHALQRLVTDEGICALAEKGCGRELTHLTMRQLGEKVTDRAIVALAEQGCGSALVNLLLQDLWAGVTDNALRALAHSGCGMSLTHLSLLGLRRGVSDAGLRALAALGQCGRVLVSASAEGVGMTTDDVPGALGVAEFPEEQESSVPFQAVYHRWRLRRDQWLFLCDHQLDQDSCPSQGVAAWDAEHNDPREQLDPLLFTWMPSSEERLLLCMLPVEVWQVVLGFCPFEEYQRLVRLRLPPEIAVEANVLEWQSRPASREFYHLLKHSLLEMRFDYMLPSPCMGGLWLASRAPAATVFVRSLRLENMPVSAPGVVEEINEVVPLPLVREFTVSNHRTRRLCMPLDELRQALAPFLRKPGKCVVKIV